MDRRRDQSPSNQALRLLAPCARFWGGDDFYDRLARQAAGFQHWDALPALAEEHGMAPLLHRGLRAAGAPVPGKTMRILAGLRLRHRRANRVRARILAQAAGRLEAEGVRPVALKGMALAHMLYPEPGLRPMSDIDLLIEPGQCEAALAVFREMGFRQYRKDGPLPAMPHLAPLVMTRDCVTAAVELHPGSPRGLLLAGPSGRALAAKPGERDGLLSDCLFGFEIEGRRMHCLGLEDMLLHLGRHLVRHWPRLIWMADLAGLAEEYQARIDWPRLQSRAPAIIGALSHFHALAPLSPGLLERAGIRTPQRPRPPDACQYIWPQRSIVQGRRAGVGRVLRDTFFPPPWWLALRAFPRNKPYLALYRFFIFPLKTLFLVLRKTPSALKKRRAR